MKLIDFNSLMDLYIKTGKVDFKDLAFGIPIVLSDSDYKQLRVNHPISSIEWANSASPVVTLDILKKSFGYGTKYLDFDDVQIKEYKPKCVVLYSYLNDKLIASPIDVTYDYPVLYLGEL